MVTTKTPYIGSKISLISRSDIRYEGILYNVDTNDSTIALAKVRSFGTEDRPVAKPVEMRPEVYEYIIFKASDIKDLIICDNASKYAPLTRETDPAIVTVSPFFSAQQQPPAIDALVGPHAGLARHPNISHGPRNVHQRVSILDGMYSSPNRRGGSQQRGSRGGARPGVPQPTEKIEYQTDYDFCKANEAFKETLEELAKLKVGDGDKKDKKEEAHLKEKGDCVAKKEQKEGAEKTDKLEKDPKKEDSELFYDKKASFFDRISCEALERKDGNVPRVNWRKERETNQETFGTQAVRAFYRRGGVRFGRGGRNNNLFIPQQRAGYNPLSGLFGYGGGSFQQRFNNFGGGYRRNNYRAPGHAIL